MDIFSRKSLNAHNKYRAQHNVPLLTWSNSIAREAQLWAKNLAKEGKLMHAKDMKSDVGENAFMSSEANFDDVGEEATESWYSEVERYDFSKGGYQSGTGHFTQVVWKGSKELGVARAKSKNGSVFVVGRYKPSGNNLNAYTDNVLPKESSGSQDKESKSEKESGKPTKQKGDVEDMGPIHLQLVIKPATNIIVDESLISRILDTHNNYRLMHDAVPLKWSATLAKDAQAWAVKIAREGRLGHASREDRYYKGENICRMSEHFDINDAVRIWYSEGGNYDYDKPGFDMSTGHFTQIVWQGTREVGVGFAKSPDGKLTYAVARYNPPGNILKKFEENVSPNELEVN